MSEFKKGDRVLVEAEWINVDELLLVGYGKGRGTILQSPWPRLVKVHPHPGVPVADIVTEAQAAGILIDAYDGGYDGAETVARGRALYDAFRAAREAASKPKLQEGQEVWVRARVEAPEAPPAARGMVLVCLPNGMEASPVSHDDIKVEEP